MEKKQKRPVLEIQCEQGLRFLFEENRKLYFKWCAMWEDWRQCVAQALKNLERLAPSPLAGLLPPLDEAVPPKTTFPEPLCGVIRTFASRCCEELPHWRSSLVNLRFGIRTLGEYLCCQGGAHHSHDFITPIPTSPRSAGPKEEGKPRRAGLKEEVKRAVVHPSSSLPLMPETEELIKAALRNKRKLLWEQRSMHAEWKAMDEITAAEARLYYYYRKSPEFLQEGRNGGFDFNNGTRQVENFWSDKYQFRFTSQLSVNCEYFCDRAMVWDLKESAVVSYMRNGWNPTLGWDLPPVTHIVDLRRQGPHGARFYEVLEKHRHDWNLTLTLGFHGYKSSNLDTLLDKGLRTEFSRASSLWCNGVYFSESFQYSWTKFTSPNRSNARFCSCDPCCKGVLLCLLYTPVEFPSSLLPLTDKTRSFPVFEDYLVPDIRGQLMQDGAINWNVTLTDHILPIAWIGLAHNEK